MIMNQILNKHEIANEKLSFQAELVFDEEFAFEIEELDSNRAMMLIVPLDPPSCSPSSCH